MASKPEPDPWSHSPSLTSLRNLKHGTHIVSYGNLLRLARCDGLGRRQGYAVSFRRTRRGRAAASVQRKREASQLASRPRLSPRAAEGLISDSAGDSEVLRCSSSTSAPATQRKSVNRQEADFVLQVLIFPP